MYDVSNNKSSKKKKKKLPLIIIGKTLKIYIPFCKAYTQLALPTINLFKFYFNFFFPLSIYIYKNIYIVNIKRILFFLKSIFDGKFFMKVLPYKGQLYVINSFLKF